MTGRQEHVEDRLIALAAGDLDGAERAAVEAHVAGCAACRQAQADFARVASAVARPAAPPLHWGAYRAELRAKLDARGAGGARSSGSWGWSLRPLSMAVAAGLVAVMVWIGGPGGSVGTGDLALDDSVLAARLGLISSLDLVQELDLLEDLDVIRGLDNGGREG
jgi:anti-sigma factor RsiW